MVFKELRTIVMTQVVVRILARLLEIPENVINDLVRNSEYKQITREHHTTTGASLDRTRVKISARMDGVLDQLFALLVSGLGVEGKDGSRVTVNIPSAGRIPNGAIIERAAPRVAHPVRLPHARAAKKGG